MPLREIAEVSAEFAPVWKQEGGFDALYAVEGEMYRQAPGRRTLRFSRGEKSYFIKIHSGVGWREILKNLLTLKLPVLGAANEFNAIRYLDRLGLKAPRMAAYATRGLNPATIKSFIVTDDIGDSTSLEDFCRDWSKHPPTSVSKWSLIKEVAAIARKMHEGGLNHRDFYLCHFLRSHADDHLYLIDLHRAQLRKRTPRRWLVKDIGGLYYSAMDIGLTRRDLFRFVRVYSEKPLRRALLEDADFWLDVRDRALTLYGSPPSA